MRLPGTSGRTPPGVRELKPVPSKRTEKILCRTPPGVRELKLHLGRNQLILHVSRTPPGVRELKLNLGGD